MIGLAQAGVGAARAVNAPVLAVLLAILMGIALAGQLDTWIAGNTRLPYAIGLDHYLPPAFSRVHPRWGTPYVSLLVQAVAATLFLLMAQLGETVKAAYQIMVDMTVIVTFIPFLYIFGAGFRFANRIAAVSGLAVTVIAIVLSALPPPEAASAVIFEAKVVGGSVFSSSAGVEGVQALRAAAVSGRKPCFLTLNHAHGTKARHFLGEPRTVHYLDNFVHVLVSVG